MVENIIFQESEADSLFEQILIFKVENKIEDLNVIELIFEYCYKKNLDFVEVGEILAESKEIKAFIENDLIDKKYIRVKGKKFAFGAEIVDDDWE